MTRRTKHGRWAIWLLCLAMILGAFPLNAGAQSTQVDPEPFAIFEDGNRVPRTYTECTALFNRMLSTGADTVQMTNAYETQHQECLRAADAVGIRVLFGPMQTLYRDWYRSSAPMTLAAAKVVAQPIVDKLSPHPSVVGYYIADELSNTTANRDRFRLMVQAFREIDPSRPAFGSHNASAYWWDDVQRAADPAVWHAFSYPITPSTPECGWFGADYSRTKSVMSGIPAGTPFWKILQTHGSDQFNLRAPTIPELRAQQWRSVAQGATGLSWFIWGSQQGWTGLADATELRTEVSDLARRFNLVRDDIHGTRPSTQRFTAGGGLEVVTLAGNNRTFGVVLNPECGTSTTGTLNTSLGGELLNLEGGERIANGSTVTIAPGDGVIFEVVPSQAGTSPTPTPSATPQPTPTPEPSASPSPTPRPRSEPQPWYCKWFPELAVCQ